MTSAMMTITTTTSGHRDLRGRSNSDRSAGGLMRGAVVA
jgi:hypothetical protein